MLVDIVERIGQTFSGDVLRIAEVNRRRSRAASRPSVRSDLSLIL